MHPFYIKQVNFWMRISTFLVSVVTTRSLGTTRIVVAIFVSHLPSVIILLMGIIVEAPPMLPIPLPVTPLPPPTIEEPKSHMEHLA